MSCLAPDSKRYCKTCAKYGYLEEEIIVLSTFDQRETNILNLDGSKHKHLFSQEQWDWDHYEDSSVVAKWDKRA